MDQAIHCYRNGCAFETEDPDVGEGGGDGGFTVAAEELGYHSDEGEEDADEAVLEDANPDDL